MKELGFNLKTVRQTINKTVMANERPATQGGAVNNFQFQRSRDLLIKSPANY